LPPWGEEGAPRSRWVKVNGKQEAAGQPGRKNGRKRSVVFWRGALSGRQPKREKKIKAVLKSDGEGIRGKGVVTGTMIRGRGGENYILRVKRRGEWGGITRFAIGGAITGGEKNSGLSPNGKVAGGRRGPLATVAPRRGERNEGTGKFRILTILIRSREQRGKPKTDKIRDRRNLQQERSKGEKQVST